MYRKSLTLSLHYGIIRVSRNHRQTPKQGGNNMDGQVLAYVRVSTIEQNEERQLIALERYNPDKIFKEKVSAKDTNRPELQRLLEFAREGDTIVVHDFSRLARNTRDLLDITEQLKRKGVTLISNKENIDTSTPTGKLMLTMIGAIAEFERQNLLDRQREGIAIAKEKGVYKGRKPIEIDDSKFTEVYNRYMSRGISKVDMAKELGVSRPTLDRMITKYQEKNK